MIELTVKCDVCGEPKKPSNGWTVATITNENNSPTRVNFQKWDIHLAEQNGSFHLCGTDCEAKFLTRITSQWRGVTNG